jgi:hypothetical protein
MVGRFGVRRALSAPGSGTSWRAMRIRKRTAAEKKGGNESLGLPREKNPHSQNPAINAMDNKTTLRAQGSTAPYARGAKTTRNRTIERITRSHSSECNE